MSNYSVVETVAQEPVWAVAPVWMLDYTSELVNENRNGKRDASGKFLKLHVKMETPAKRHSVDSLVMAAKFGTDADDLFAGGR